MFPMKGSDFRYLGHWELTPEEREEARKLVAKFEAQFVRKKNVLKKNTRNTG